MYSQCELCGKHHDGIYGSGRFCSAACARSFSTKEKRKEINSAVSKKLSNSIPKYKNINCIGCNKEFTTITKSKICSDECRFNIKSSASKKGRDTAKKRGTFTGWKVRTKNPSYAEKYFIDLFANECITGYIREYNVNKWFVDFAFVDKMIAVEVDGKQHKVKERQISDYLKDSWLKTHGWSIIRIDWYNPRTQPGKDKLYPQIKNLINMLRQNGV